MQSNSCLVVSSKYCHVIKIGFVQRHRAPLQAGERRGGVRSAWACRVTPARRSGLKTRRATSRFRANKKESQLGHAHSAPSVRERWFPPNPALTATSLRTPSESPNSENKTSESRRRKDGRRSFKEPETQEAKQT